jgi:DedD protein
MVDNPQAEAAEDSKIKRQLIGRGVLAGALIAALLGVLLLVERSQEPEPAPTVHVPKLGPSFSEGQSGAISSLAAETSQAIGAAPLVAEASTPTAEPEPEETAPPTLAGEAATSKPDVTIAPAAGSPAARGITGERARSSERPAAPPAELAARSALAPALTPVPAPATTAANGVSANGFFVQLGVFTSVDNAEQLVRRLKQHGLTAHLETRVQMGPFKTREEALVAQRNLNAAGMPTGMVVPAPARK